MKTYSTKKRAIIRKRVVKRNPKEIKDTSKRKRLCEKCKRRFDRGKLVVHHKENRRRLISRINTEGMPVTKFDKLYRDKRKRPAHDRRDNILVLCRSCYRSFAK